MRNLFVILALLLSYIFCQSQNTVGTLINTDASESGYLLFSPRTTSNDKNSYLIDNCGDIIHSWPSIFPLFSTDYLQTDGSLWRSVVDNQSALNIPGNTGRIEHLDWDGNLLWGATISEEDFSFHHDYVIMDNGNILLIVAFSMSAEEAITQGRNPETLLTDELYEERIWEIETIGTNQYNIVWEWRSWDHLIQDFDETKDNYGIVEEHPELVDINFGTSFGEADWWHSNAISYSSTRDQITLSNRNLDEFIIIDHSTTTEEAASHSGGNSNMGGDIIYRYGNPQSYDRGTEDDQKLSAMHDVHFINSGSPSEGKIMIFNNGPDFGFSSVQIIDPEFDENTFTYFNDGGAYGPDTVSKEYSDPDNFFSAFLSGSQELPNGNFLITMGPSGNIIEVNDNGDIVWQYQSPVGASGILADGQDPTVFQTRVFRSLRYPLDYEGFDGRDLTPTQPIEISPSPFDCNTLSLESIEEDQTVRLFPNPTKNFIKVQSLKSIDSNSVFDLKGRLILTTEHMELNLSNIPKGVYIIQTNFSNGQTLINKVIKN